MNAHEVDDSPRQGSLPAGFRRRDLAERRKELRETFALGGEEWEALSATPLLREISDVMVESSVGAIPIPLGIADGFLVDGADVAIPMAVEEPSVIAAATFAARLIRRDGGFRTWATEPLMTTQVFLEGVSDEGERNLRACESEVRAVLAETLGSLERRGGGYRNLRVTRLECPGTVRIDVVIDVRDSMGANRLNTSAESLKPLLKRASGGRALMAILSNAATERRAGARFALSVQRLAPRLPAGMSAEEAARRIATASAIAQEDPVRAVTHNKGIMNGISSLALASREESRYNPPPS